MSWPTRARSRWQVLKGFKANQGLLLAGAVAYYALLSVVPLLILTVIALSHVVDQAELLQHAGPLPRVAGAGPVARHRRRARATSCDHRDVVGWVLLVTMLFFSSLAFTVLENAMSVIFLHRVAIRRRHFLVSALLPYCYILSPGRRPAAGDAGRRQPAGDGRGERRLSSAATGRCSGVSGVLLYLLGLRRRGLRADLGLPGDAGGPAVAGATR